MNDLGDLEQLSLPPTQLFSDAELDVYTQNMLQTEDLSPETLLSMFDDPPQPALAAPPPNPRQAACTRLPAKQASHLGRPSSVFSSEGSFGSNTRGSGEGAVPGQDQQQLYASMFEQLMPDASQLTYPPTGPLTQPLPTALGRAQGSAEGSEILGASQGSGEGFATDTTRGGHSDGTQRTASGSGAVRHSNSFGAASSGGDAMQSGGTGSPGGTGGGQGTSSGGEADGDGNGQRARTSGRVNPSTAKMLREKHRSAQRRYRERLRAKHEEADQRVEQLTRELDQLKAAQSALQHRNETLEAHIKTQQAQPAPPAVQPPPIPSPTPPPPVAMNPQPSPQSSSGQSPLFEQPSLSNRYKLNDQTWELIKDSVGAIDDKLTFTVNEGKPVSYSRRELSNFTTMQYKDLWKDYVNAFAHCLMLCNEDDTAPAYPRLLQLLAETRALKLTFCMLRPDLLSAWAQYAAEQRGMPTAQFWAGIAASLTISPDQLHRMLLVRNAALRNLGAMIAQRRELLASLSNNTAVTVQLDNMTSIDALQTKTAAQHMDALLRHENSFIAEISTVVTEDVLTPLQLAHVITLAWPFGVNIMSIMNCIAAQAGAPPVTEMLRQGAMAGGASLSPLRQALVAD